MKALRFEEDAFEFVTRISEPEAKRRITELEMEAQRRMRKHLSRISADRKGLSFYSYFAEQEKLEVLRLKTGLHMVSIAKER